MAPSQREVEASIAATIYSVWRGQMLRNTIDRTIEALEVPGPVSQRQYVTALRRLLDSFERNQGVGASGVDFFDLRRITNRCHRSSGTATADLPAVVRRDIFILSSLADALDRLVGDAFARAFHRSRNQADYRWGRVHRGILPHPLGTAFSLNAAAPAYQPFAGQGLPGVPTDGGYETVDVASHGPRANAENDFIFEHAPAFRTLAERGGAVPEFALPGGSSGIRGIPFFANLLRPWLTNDYLPLRRQ